MVIALNIPAYNKETGIAYNWEKGFTIQVDIIDGVAHIKANQSGLISLANHLLNLSQADVPLGSHMHFDEINSLEDGSTELVIEKIA